MRLTLFNDIAKTPRGVNSSRVSRRSIAGKVLTIAVSGQATFMSVLPCAACRCLPSPLLSLVRHHRHYCEMDGASVALSRRVSIPPRLVVMLLCRDLVRFHTLRCGTAHMDDRHYRTRRKAEAHGRRTPLPGGTLHVRSLATQTQRLASIG